MTTDRQMKVIIGVTVAAVALALGIAIGRSTKQTHVYRFEGPGAEAMNKMAENWPATQEANTESPRVTPPLPEAPLSGMKARRVHIPAGSPSGFLSEMYPGGVPMSLKVPIEHPIMTMPLPCGHRTMMCYVTPSGGELATCVDGHSWSRAPDLPQWSGKWGDTMRLSSEMGMF